MLKNKHLLQGSMFKTISRVSTTVVQKAQTTVDVPQFGYRTSALSARAVLCSTILCSCVRFLTLFIASAVHSCPQAWGVFLGRGHRTRTRCAVERSCTPVVVWVHVFFEYMAKITLNFTKGPWPLRRSRGDGNGGRCARSPCLPFLRRTPDAVPWPLRPCTAAVHRAPGHNRWGVVETPLPAKTQERTLDCIF